MGMGIGGRWWDWGRWIGGRIAWKVRGGGNEKRGCRVELWRVGSKGRWSRQALCNVCGKILRVCGKILKQVW